MKGKGDIENKGVIKGKAKGDIEGELKDGMLNVR